MFLSNDKRKNPTDSPSGLFFLHIALFRQCVRTNFCPRIVEIIISPYFSYVNKLFAQVGGYADLY